MDELDQHELTKAIEAINKNLEPHKIYLFGSYAHGHPDNESDLDLCVLTDELKERKIEALRKIRHSLLDHVSIPVDLLLYTSKEFNDRACLSSTLEHKIVNDGILVYGS